MQLTAPLLFWGVNPWLVALSFVPGITAAGTMLMIATIGTGVRAGTGDK